MVLGFPGTTIDGEDRFALEVLSTVLGGQGGRLFDELREQKGLVYSVTALNLEGIERGYFAVYAATAPAKLIEAAASITEILGSVTAAPLPADELDRARRYLVGAHDIGLQRIGALASTMAFDEAYGLGHDAYRSYADRVLAVTVDDLLRVAQRVIRMDAYTLAVVAPEGTDIPLKP